ncbi:unnamed protein product [Linum tenue]|uniref:BHLH domain-containing protein n=1 Tax=Linum tenue TaxID=586396 RepID=A0AAV0HM33_9ROSI|nr:unnamed protein product [Linum tenue]
MAARLDSVVELLRPLVYSRAWDYCVVWKLTNDPSRVVEWMGCCCSGAEMGSVDPADSVVKQEIGAEVMGTRNFWGPLCRDVHLKHRISTMACQALARLPSFMPLYSGIHGEVAISSRSRWLHHAGNVADSECHSESSGTQVLIPVLGGLVELFAAKHVPEDKKIVDLIMTHCNMLLLETLKEDDLNPLLQNEFHDLLSPFHMFSLIPEIQLLPPTLPLQLSTASNGFEGSSSTCRPSNGYPLLDLCYSPFSVQNAGSGSSTESKYQESFLKKQAPSPRVVSQGKQKLDRNTNKSKNLTSERNRRNRIQERMLSLRALVPKITKMDKVSIIGDAIEYIIELQNEKQRLLEELQQIENEQGKEVDVKQELGDDDLPVAAKTRRIEAQLDVTRINKNEYLIKLLYHQKNGGFVKLMETLSSLGLQVVDANITNFDGQALNILRVEVPLRLLCSVGS